MAFKNKEFLITGGTGSLGKTLVKKLATDFHTKGIRIYSRDELKQWEFKNTLDRMNIKNVSFLLGDVRDYHRLERAMDGVDYVINCAAIKQVPACEYNPIEAIKTNVHGAENILNASLNMKVEKVMHISTDKAVYPVNLYGVTKAAAEKLFIHGNVYGGLSGTKFSCCRYGNVLKSRGSIVPLFRAQMDMNGEITITDKRMTRFWIHLHEVVDFILENLLLMDGGEIFIPKMISSKVLTIAKHLAESTPKGHKINIKEIGIRQGEKLHECLITSEESMMTEVHDFKFVIKNHITDNCLAESWTYVSNENPRFINNQSLMEKIFLENSTNVY